MTKIAFVTFGCTLNFADSELMMGLLKESGYSIVDDAEDADLIVVNGCSVKNLAESKFFKAIRDSRTKKKKIVVAGCVAQAEPEYLDTKLKYFSVIGTKQLNKIVHVVEETLDGNVVHMIKDGKNDRLNIPKVRRNSIIGIVPIAEGCLGNCTYCKARLARGKLVSYDPEEIVKQVVSDVIDGCKEIRLTSQDCGAYGKDIGTSITALLRAVLEVKGDFMVRLGMMNPNFAFEYLPELVEIFKGNKGKLYRFIHIPVQSGNDRVLGLMNRKYSADDFIKVCSTLRKEMPDLTIATDVICGFPTETEQEFQDTLDLMDRIKPDIINISRFWPRPGTPASTMKQLMGKETNVRSRRLKMLFEKISLERNKQWEGWTGEVLVDEMGSKTKEGSFMARNYAYKPFVIKEKTNLGQKIKIKATKAYTYHIQAKIIK